MQRFVFSVFDGEIVGERIAEEHAGLREASARALQMTSDLIRADEAAWLLHEWRVDVSDENGLILITIGAYAREAAASMGRSAG